MPTVEELLLNYLNFEEIDMDSDLGLTETESTVFYKMLKNPRFMNLLEHLTQNIDEQLDGLVGLFNEAIMDETILEIITDEQDERIFNIYKSVIQEENKCPL
jgi:hypothetical protein